MPSVRTSTERRILEAASELFLRYGFEKTTMDDIAREARVAKATLYRYWPSKEALFESLLYREIREVNRAFLARVQADARGGTIGRIIYHGFAATYDRPFLRALMTTEGRTLGDYLRRHSPHLSHWQFRLDRQLVEALQRAGVLRDDIETGLLTYLLSMVSLGLASAAEFIAPEYTPPVEALAEGIAEMVERAFAPPSGGNSARGKEVLRHFIGVIDEGLAELERATYRKQLRGDAG